MSFDTVVFDGDANVSVIVQKGDKLQEKTATPSDEVQVVRPDDGFFGLSSVTVEAIAEGSATTPATEITAEPAITVGADGLITATVSESESITPTIEPGYVDEGTAGTVSVSGSATEQLSTQAAAVITPTEEQQTAVAAGKYTTGAVTVDAIPSDYVGSGIPERDSTDLVASGNTVTVPAGYYEESASKAVQSGTEGTPIATKGAVSNHAVSITPSVTNAEGYIDGGTHTGTAVTVAASELVSGTKSITANGTDIDVTEYAAVNVSVDAPTPVLETVTKTYTPTESTQTETITPASGYDGIGEVDVTVNAISSTYVGSGITRRDDTDLTASGPTVTVPAGYYEDSETKTVASGTEGTPTATKGTVSNHSVDVTPSVTNSAGYIQGGTHSGTAVTVSASELDSGTKSITQNGASQDVVGYAAVDVAVPNTYSAGDEGKVVSNGALVAQSAHADVTPTTSDQTIDTTTNDSIKVKGDADLVASNIKKDVEIFGVTGSYEGGGGGVESGSFIASSPLDAVTIPVTSKKSYVAFWIHGMTGNMDLSSAPYGTNHLVYYYADEDIQMCAGGQTNYDGKQWGGSVAKTSTTGASNTVVFSNNSIAISVIRVGGANRSMVDGATYDWKAW